MKYKPGDTIEKLERDAMLCCGLISGRYILGLDEERYVLDGDRVLHAYRGKINLPKLRQLCERGENDQAP